MYCKKCGRNLPEQAKFCPKCGNAVALAIKKKKKTHKIAAVVTSLAILIGACSGVFVFRKEIFPFLFGDKGEEDVYSEVDNEVNALFADAEYNKLDIESQKSEVEKLLTKMEKDGTILKGSVEYDEETEIFWYKYINNTETGIMMREPDPDFAGNAQANDYITWQSPGLADPNSIRSEIDFDSGNYPYSREQIESLDLKALYMYGWSDENDVKNGQAVCYDDYLENQKVWNSNGLKTDIDYYCTVEDFKTELLGYDLIFICEHGNFQEGYPIICSQEKVSNDNFSDYKKDYEEGLIVSVQPNGSNCKYWWIKPGFFEKYYSGNKLKDSIVWISSCHGYQSDELVETFANCGARAVVGYNNSVLINYDFFLHTAAVYSMMYGDSVSEALKFSQSIWKKTDTDFYVEYNGTRTKYGTFIDKKTFDQVANYAQARVKPGGESCKLVNEEEMIDDDKKEEAPSETEAPVKPAKPDETLLKEAYKSLIKQFSFDDSISTIEYTLYDMNNDDIPELITKTGNSEADYRLSFYTYRDGIGLVPVGTNFSGFHISFRVDRSTGQFCTIYGHMGGGGIVWYTFDGDSVTELKRQDNIEYANWENYEDAYAPYGDFENLDSTYCFNSWDKGWVTFKNNSEETGIDYSMIDNY